MSRVVTPPPVVTESPLIVSNELQLKQGLQECLDSTESDGSFALFALLENSPNPGIHLRDGGTVGLPLSDRDAKAIMAASHAAPFGKGEQTIVDANVRKTWELAPVDFELRNPAWQSYIQGIAANAASGLGVDATGNTVSAELYKMLLYDEGAMFKPHQDSEKKPRMFATMVVALPSKHEGGEVLVTHQGKTEVFRTSLMSAHGTSCLAWFADVTHEVKPVLSGRRLVLTYNLVHSTFGSRELNAASKNGLVKLRPLMQSWMANAGVNASSSYAYLLSHQYTEASLCFDGLKGHDQQVVALLRQVCTEQNLCLYLANLDLTIEGGCHEDGADDRWGGDKYHQIIDEFSRCITLIRAVQLNGVELAKDLNFNEEMFIQQDPLGGQWPNDEDYSGYTGNEGVTATHFYHRTVIVMMPKAHRMNFFFPPEIPKTDAPYNYLNKPKPEAVPNIAGWLTSLSDELSQNPHDQDTWGFLNEICKIMIGRTKTWKAEVQSLGHNMRLNAPPFSEREISLLITTLVDLKNKELVLEACDIFPGTGSVWAWRSLGAAILMWNLHGLLPMLSAKLADVSNLTFRITAIFALLDGLGVEPAVSPHSGALLKFTEWGCFERDKALSTMIIDSVSDGLLLAKLSKTAPHQAVLSKIVPAVKRNAHFTAMTVAFINAIFDLGLEGSIPPNTIHAVLRAVIVEVADGLALKFLEQSLPAGMDNIVHTHSRHGSAFLSRNLSQPPTSIVIDAEKSREVAAILHHCFELGLRSELDLTLAMISAKTKVCKLAMFESIIFPFLAIFKALLAEKQVKFQDSPFQAFFCQILTIYIDRFVQAEPQEPADWARATVSCSCQDCKPMQEFLKDPHQQIGRFTLVSKQREHLQENMEVTHHGFGYETDRTRSPQTLVITKTKEEYHALVRDWKERRSIARLQIAELGGDDLKKFLDQFNDQVKDLGATTPSLVAGESSHRSDSGPALKPSYSASIRVLSPPSRRKTPQNCILIDDD